MVELTADVRASFLSRIGTGSTLAELPGYEASLEMSDRAKKWRSSPSTAPSW